VSLKILIQTGSSVPIYRQIVEQVRARWRRASDGGRSIAQRADAGRNSALNPNTVARAYGDLAREGVIETQPGRGVFIIPKRKVITREEARRRLEPLLNSLISEALAMDFSTEDLAQAFASKINQWKKERAQP
jgi:GntR family transcriptional regulator